MPHSDSDDDTPAPAGSLRDALRELREAGGMKRLIHCRFGFSTLQRLVEAEWVTIDDGLPIDSRVRLTSKGSTAVDDA